MPNIDEPPDLEVNIPIPGGLRVTRETQPYQILFVADFAGSQAGRLGGPLTDSVVRVTADSLAETMRAARPLVSFKTADPVASGNVMVEVNLAFDSFKAFEPMQLAAQVPAAQALLATREKIVGRMRGELTSEGLAGAVAKALAADAGLSWLQDSLKWTPARPAAEPGAVDDILGRLDLGDESQDKTQPPPKTPVGKLVAAAAGGGATIPSEEASACRRTLAELDRRVSAWLTAVLHSSQVQAVESTWRSLAFLVSRIDFRKGVRLSILHAPAGELVERIAKLLIDPVFDQGVEAPDVIVVDREFGNTAADMEALDELAQHAASLPAVFLTGVSPQFFGVKYAWQMETLPTITNTLDQWQFAKWRALRDKPYARSLGVVFGRCLLREPHRRDEARDLEFAFSEPCVTDKDLVWANGSVAAACTIARSIAETGWPTGISGYVHGRVDGFKTAEGGKKGDKHFGPADAQLTESKIEELGMAGLNAVAAPRDLEEVLVWNGMTAARISRNDTAAILEVSLPYQLFACRLSGLLYALKPHLSALSAEKIAPFVTQHVRDWVSFEGRPDVGQVSAQTRPAEENAAVLEMAVTVTPPLSLLPGGVPIVMGYRLA